MPVSLRLERTGENAGQSSDRRARSARDRCHRAHFKFGITRDAGRLPARRTGGNVVQTGWWTHLESRLPAMWPRLSPEDLDAMARVRPAVHARVCEPTTRSAEVFVSHQISRFNGRNQTTVFELHSQKLRASVDRPKKSDRRISKKTHRARKHEATTQVKGALRHLPRSEAGFGDENRSFGVSSPRPSRGRLSARERDPQAAPRGLGTPPFFFRPPGHPVVVRARWRARGRCPKRRRPPRSLSAAA